MTRPNVTVHRATVSIPQEVHLRIMQLWGRRIQQSRQGVTYSETLVDLVRRGLDSLKEPPAEPVEVVTKL